MEQTYKLLRRKMLDGSLTLDEIKSLYVFTAKAFDRAIVMLEPAKELEAVMDGCLDMASRLQM